jgi:hypothetical protein
MMTTCSSKIKVSGRLSGRTVLVRAYLKIVSARVRSCFSWSTRPTCSDGTLRGFMVRRRSTVRFRKGAPGGLHTSPGSMFTFGSDILVAELS